MTREHRVARLFTMDYRSVFPSLAIALVLGLCGLGPAGAAEPAIERIAFGSCCRQDRDQRIWKAVTDTKPDLFVFSGDNIYGDTEDMTVLREKYAVLGADDGYRRLVDTCPILATWDDHDYGVNDGGREYPKRGESQQIFLDFFGVSESSPRRRREGVYHAETFGPAGRRVQVVLLDTRFFRSPLRSRPKVIRRIKGFYHPNTDPGATVLGEAQWQWLEETLREEADLRIIVSSIQVIPSEQIYEKWDNFPRERERLFDVLGKTGAKQAILISGDRHHAEISRLPAEDPVGPGWPVYEVTSSGLTHTGNGNAGEPNRYRVSDGNFGELNFGTLDLEWNQGGGVTATVRIRDVEGGEVMRQVLVFR